MPQTWTSAGGLLPAGFAVIAMARSVISAAWADERTERSPVVGTQVGWLDHVRGLAVAGEVGRTAYRVLRQ